MASKWEPAATAGARASMAANQSGRTRPELMLRFALTAFFGEGAFVCNDRSLPGVPDMAFHAERVAVFMHGCYWHSCPSCHPGGAAARRTGGANADLWIAKFLANEARFERQFGELLDNGWWPLVVWECNIKRDLPACVLTVKYFMEGARDGSWNGRDDKHTVGPGRDV